MIIIFTAPTAPRVMSMSSRRLNMTSFNISVVLAYTGGDFISHFAVKYRQRNASQWSTGLTVESRDGGRMEQGLLWYGIVTDPGLGKPSELLVVVVNDAQESSSSFVLKETLGESLPHSIQYT